MRDASTAPTSEVQTAIRARLHELTGVRVRIVYIGGNVVGKIEAIHSGGVHLVEVAPDYRQSFTTASVPISMIRSVDPE